MKRVLLIGNFGSRNVGDEIILWTVLQKYPNSVVMSADEVFSRRFLGKSAESVEFIKPFPTGIRSFLKFLINPKSREKIRKTLKTENIEKIIFPGGGLLAIKIRAYLIWGLTFLWLKKYLPKTEIHFEHQGVDRTTCPLKKKIVETLFKNSNKISVRDEISRDFLSTLNIKSDNEGDCVEVFLRHNFKKPENKSKNIILINACRENSAKFKELCTKEIVPTGTACQFICFDPLDARYVPEKFHGKIVFPETVEETFSIFQKTKTAIGQRLHFLILAEFFCGAKNTFILEKPYSQKVENFTKKYGIGRR